VLQEQRSLFPDSRLPFLGLLELAVERGDWDEAVRLADETVARTHEGDYAGKHELAYELIHIPTRREEGISLLRRIAPALRDPGPVLLMLGTVLEKAGDPEGAKFIARARRAWNAPVPFEDALAEKHAYVEKHLPG
jgi:hypothetical protein